MIGSMAGLRRYSEAVHIHVADAVRDPFSGIVAVIEARCAAVLAPQRSSSALPGLSGFHPGLAGARLVPLKGTHGARADNRPHLAAAAERPAGSDPAAAGGPRTSGHVMCVFRYLQGQEASVCPG